jgi:signal transduction histidine kinase
MGNKLISFILAILLLPVMSYSLGLKAELKAEVRNYLDQRLKSDSLAIVSNLDSANISFSQGKFNKAISFAGRSYDLSRGISNSDFVIQSIIILARSYRDKYLQDQYKPDFDNTLKYYLKAINALESVNSRWLLPNIYREYGDFYLQLNLVDLTIKNYQKALSIVRDNDNGSDKLEVLSQLAVLSQDHGNTPNAIDYYTEILKMHIAANDKANEIETRKTLAQLYWESKDYDNAITLSKIIYDHYSGADNLLQQITYLSQIGEISYEAGNNYQADNAFKRYFNLVKHDDEVLAKEISSLRYIKNLIIEGDIYTWSTDNGFWSDYETAIRFYNEAHNKTDFELYPELASEILNRSAIIFYKKEDYKTCITYFNLALHYAQRTQNHEQISTNLIMLARAYDEIEQWKNASQHYELHSAYKDSIIRSADLERAEIARKLVQIEKENVMVEQTLDIIESQEIRELAFEEKELRNIALENELELVKQDAALKSMIIQNQALEEDSINRHYLFTKQLLENEQNAKKIDSLKAEQDKQNLRFQNQKQDRKVEQQRIKILEQENSLARSQQDYYVLSIVLISLVLVFILLIYLQIRRANKKLKLQNEKIENQSEKLKQAYDNLKLLSTIGRDITSSLIIEEIIETVYENLNTLMDASVLGIGVFEPLENRLHFPGVREKSKRLKDINIDLTMNTTLASYCFINQEEIVLDNYFEDYAKYIDPPVKPVYGDGNSTSVVFLPLTIGSKRLGVLTVQSFYENAFNEYHINIIRNIAIYAKIALENANVYKELEQQSENLQKANKHIGEKNKLIKEQNEELININEEKNNLMKILAHDLRNPLATAMSMTELVRFEKENLSAEQYQASEIIWRGLNRMNDMIRKILDVKAVESQIIQLDYEVLNVNEILASLEQVFAEKAESKHITFHFSTNSDDPLINVDRNYFIQVMENLISNALKFSPLHKNVFIKVREIENSVLIAVKDEGPGIPKDEFSRLFRKYHKLSPKPTGGEQSIGLGLSIVKKYVEVMDGKVWCRSDVTSGAEFVLEFAKEPVPVS